MLTHTVCKLHQGFTLIEVLVVLGVIGTMLAILLPVFASVRARSRQTVCTSNLRQLGTSIFLYAQDYDQRMPYAGDPTDKYTDIWQGKDGGAYADEARHLSALSDVLAPYIKSPQLWQCPADTGFNYVDCAGVVYLPAHPSSFQVFGTSYYYRTEVGLGRKLVDLVVYEDVAPYTQHSSAEINLLMDGTGQWHGTSAGFRYNTLMADGHVVPLTREAMTDAWDLQLDPPKGSSKP